MTACSLIRLPRDADLLQLAMAGGNPLTAWALLHGLRDVPPGSWVIQNAGNSAVGLCLSQLANAWGINVISLVRRREALDDLARAPNSHGLLDGNDLAERVAALTGGTMPVIAYDAIGGDATGRLASAIEHQGLLVTYGLLSGEDCCLPPHHLVFRDIHLHGFWLASWLRRQEPSFIHEQLQALIEKIRTGRLGLPVEATYPLTSAQEAVAHAMSSRQGKILFCPGQRSSAKEQ